MDGRGGRRGRGRGRGRGSGAGGGRGGGGGSSFAHSSNGRSNPLGDNWEQSQQQHQQQQQPQQFEYGYGAHGSGFGSDFSQNTDGGGGRGRGKNGRGRGRGGGRGGSGGPGNGGAGGGSAGFDGQASNLGFHNNTPNDAAFSGFNDAGSFGGAFDGFAGNNSFGGRSSAGFGFEGGAGGGAGAGFGAGGGASSGRKQPLAYLEVSGYPPDAKAEELMAFFSTNGPPNLRLFKFDMRPNQNLARFGVPENFLADILGLSGRNLRANTASPLLIEKASTGPRLEEAEIQTLRQFVSQNYDREHKALSLTAAASRLPQIADFKNRNFVIELCKVMKIAAEGLVSLDLSSNGIESLSGFSRLAQYAPNLINLSLADNNITQLHQLESFANGYRETLNELILSGNPVTITPAEYAAALATAQATGTPPPPPAMDPILYHHLISSLFPNLKLLDRQQLRSIINFDLPPMISAAALPPPQGSFFDNDQYREMSVQFVNQYYSLYDGPQQPTDRHKLVSVYSENSMFSLSVVNDGGGAPGAVAPGAGPGAATAAGFGNKFTTNISTVPPAYSIASRNLLSLPTKNRAAESAALLKQGAFAIVHSLSELPRSRHDTATFIADTFLLPTANQAARFLHLSLKGWVLESETGVIRSFHRTFILAPPTVEAKSKNWPVTILNDQLLIGASKPSTTTTAGSGAVGAGGTHSGAGAGGIGIGIGAGGSSVVTGPALNLGGVGVGVGVGVGLPGDISFQHQQQLEQIQNLMRQTNCQNFELALQVWNAAGGNYELALQHLYQMKG